jgi:hypothetical protein
VVGGVNLADVMDELAERLRLAPSLAGQRTHASPPGTITPPSAIVGYPENITFDATYGRGVDTMVGTVVVVVGRPTDRSARDRLAGYAAGSGAESIKTLLDGDDGDYESCDGVRVASIEFDVFTIGDIDYLAAVFALDITGPGTA